MKKTIACVVITVLLAAGQVLAAGVKNIELSRQENATVVKIDVDGQVRFTHQTEEPKNGRPDRVIIDILAATHELGAKTFEQLPKCMVKTIRTSQFAVTPEKIVRVVLDLNGPPLYQVSSDARSVTITLTDRKSKPFATWSSAGVAPKKQRVKSVSKSKAGKTVAANLPADSKPAPTATAPVKKAVSKPAKATESALTKLAKKADSGKGQLAVATTPTRKFEPTASHAPASELSKPAISRSQATSADPTKTETKSTAVAQKSAKVTSAKAPTPVQKPQTPAKPVTVAEKSSKTTAPKASDPVKSTTAAEKTAAQTVPKATTPKKKAASKKAPVADKAKPTEHASATKETGKSVSKSVTAVPRNSAGNQGQQALAQKITKKSPTDSKVLSSADKTAPTSKSTSTARFRRTPSKLKVKGTMVAEFPKRLVIKYKGGNRRDPFATLINVTKTYDSPMEQRIPNIEGIRLVGIIEAGEGANRALFEDTDGYGYILKSGDKVRNGYVLRVDAKKVFFQIFEYGWSRTVAMSIED